MENIKFYNVKIGTNTRAGNLNVLQSFVAQSDKNQSTVYHYYSNKYKGFGISVEEVSEIVKDEIPEKTVCHSNFIEEPVEQKIATFNSFTGKIRWDITNEVKAEFFKLEKLEEECKLKKTEIINKLKSYILENYGVKLIEYVKIEDFSSCTVNVPFSCKLSGNITSSNNEL